MSDLPLNTSYSNFCDEKLVGLARAGDDVAMAVLIARLAPIAKAQAAVSAGAVLEPEDLAQEGMIGFLSAVSGYDESKGASFRTYAGACIGNRIVSAIRRSLKKSEIPSAAVVSIDGEELDVEDSESDPQNILTLREENLRFLSLLEEKLSELERAVAKEYISGHSYKDIAAHLGMSDKSVDNTMQRIRKKLNNS